MLSLGLIGAPAQTQLILCPVKIALVYGSL